MGTRGKVTKISVADLASELDVSTATVSRALNGSASVRPELAQRIREHAEERGYVANRMARALSANVSRAFVGFVIPYVDTPAYSSVAAECARLMSADGTQLILTITENDPERELQQLKELVASRVAGLVISPSTHILEPTKQLLSNLPVVEFHRACGIAAPGVFSEDEQAMAEAVLHLAALGHTRIGYLGTPEALSNGSARLRGLRRGLKLAGLGKSAIAVQLLEPTTDNGRRGVEELLADRRPPTALIVGGGALSIGAARTIHESGRRWPDELSLVVYGHPSWFALSDPPLTRITVNYRDLAQRAAVQLKNLLDSNLGARATEPQQQFVTAELYLAGSTGPPPAH
ncbi:LacI family DNA-binding transcriptional regulator [Prauserella cavernicola]|uniref:LacI family DNA-binding transcriptional regulator n=1 Tax=Prauserella cavernicola TaxID=2800127 RepID=A0A934V7W6_9PSEU|nr:LacI family DNA-binding transcriptional regulator [Prauserella cavernicola]MBK1787138.1 LacI family DNA-binding transcriptional regulator [Prauserella cavernicola]